MKNLIILIFSLLLLNSCNNNDQDSIKTIKTYDNDLFRIIEIDSCEYILSDVYLGNSICHKGNCIYCLQRNKNIK